MNNAFNSFIIFSIGVVIGSAVTWKYAKTKYERIAQEEIDSVKEVFSRRNQKDPEEDEEYDRFAEEDNEVSKEKYLEVLKRKSYRTSLDDEEKTEESEPMKDDRPYVISPDEFSEMPDYEIVSLTYYADGYVTDEDDEIIDDVDDIIGSESLTHFGEYEDDSVFVRNDRLKTDYEILLDSRNYSDILMGVE